MEQLPIEIVTLILHHVCAESDKNTLISHPESISHHSYLQAFTPWILPPSRPHIQPFSHLYSPLLVNKQWNRAATRILYSHIQLDNDLSFLLLTRLFSPHSSLLKTLWSDIRLATHKRLVSLQRDGFGSFLSHLSSDSMCICSSWVQSILTGSTMVQVWKMSAPFLPLAHSKWIDYYSHRQEKREPNRTFMPVQNLSYLPDVWKTQHSPFAMTHIYGSFVTELCLHAIPCVTDEKWIPLVSQCPLLSSVDVTLCSHLTDVGIHALARHCKQLVRVKLGGLPLITPSCLHELARFHKKTLYYLDIRACPKLLWDDTSVSLSHRVPTSRPGGWMGGHALAECFMKLKQLEQVYIGHVSLMVKDGEIIEKEGENTLEWVSSLVLPQCIPVMVSHAVHLTRLHLTGLPIQDDMGVWMIQVLAQRDTKIPVEYLCLDYCPIGNKTMTALVTWYSSLQLSYLSIKGCTLVTEGHSLHQLVQHYHVGIQACEDLKNRFLL